jgi:hypothetical protein
MCRYRTPHSSSNYIYVSQGNEKIYCSVQPTVFQVLDTQSIMFSMDSSGDFLEIVEIEIWTLQVPLMNPYKVAM